MQRMRVVAGTLAAGGKGERDLEVVPLARSLSLPESHSLLIWGG